ncbi:MAG: hypothetical protein RL335_719 [Bacteroidota bacterium]
MHPQIERLLTCIDSEEKEQIQRYRLDQQHTLRSLKAEGLALHPIKVNRKNFGYADYPEISFHLPFPAETGQFRDGVAIECFASGEEPVKGVLLNIEGRTGEFRLFAPDFPDWIEDDSVGIKLAPDTRTTTIMKDGLNSIEKNPGLLSLFEKLHEGGEIENKPALHTLPTWKNKHLNASQQQAIQSILNTDRFAIVHGPPGTGKTTTLVEAIAHLVSNGEKVLLSAPSNTAVDHIAKALIQNGVQVLRTGNIGKADPDILPYTPEGKLSNSKEQKEIKELKKRAEEFRRMALKYKRNFGKAEREQRHLLFKEVKQIRAQIKQIQQYNEEKLFTSAQVIAGTPIGLYDSGLKPGVFTTLVMDEAGQCLEPLAWCLFPYAQKIILAGDHWQLPPTVLSQVAIKNGFNRSILEVAIHTVKNIHLLDTQYRMRAAIAGFSSSYFYNNLLKTAANLINTGVHLTFIDLAGSGYQEKKGADGNSLQNEGDILVTKKLIQTEKLQATETAIISPYSGQVAALKEALGNTYAIRTIDSFQGQEKKNIIISLVRSNDEGDIGFLKDYRRMNVAITRAQETLWVIGDSATIGNDRFYQEFLHYVEAHGSYRTIWELDVFE